MNTKQHCCCFALLLTATVQAVPIPIDLGSPGIVNPPEVGWTNRVNFTELNGTALSGQTVQLDFNFSPQFVRLFSISSLQFGFVAALFLDSPVTGAPLAGSGFVTGSQPVNSTFSAGAGAIDDPSNPALYMWLELDTVRPIDLYAASFTLQFPVETAHITGGQFALSNGYGYNLDTPGWYGIGPDNLPADIVPEPGVTGLLFSIGLCALVLWKLRPRFLLFFLGTARPLAVLFMRRQCAVTP